MKTGRKQKHFTDPDTGLPVVGLARRPGDGRWRVISTGHTFTESDPRRAIRKFYDLTDAKLTGTVAGIAVTANRSEWLDLRDQVNRLIEANERGYWQDVARRLLEGPKKAARLSGIEEFAYIKTLRPPEPLPSLDELEQAWKDHAKVSPTEFRKVLGYWGDFRESTGVGQLDGIRPKLVIEYRDEVHSRGLKGKSQANLFGGIRSLLSFCRKRAIAVKAIGEALDALRLLTPSESTVSLDPKPIERADFHKLLDKANAEDRALVLLSLNCAMYLQEAIRVTWDEIKDGCLVTRRLKTGHCLRVAVLWPETQAALDALPRKGDTIFWSQQGTPLSISGAEKRFRKLRDAAQVAVTSSQLRDGAYTAAVRANVTEGIVKLLVGHRGSGLSDHYVKRQPEMVRVATDAVWKAYFGRAEANKVA